MSVCIKIKHSCHRHLSTHIGNDAIHPLLVVESFIVFPIDFRVPEVFVIVHRQIKQQHFVVGHTRHKSAERLIVPDVSLITEHPALHHPNSIFVGLLDGAIHFFTIRCRHLVTGGIALLRERNLHLIETVDKIIATLAKLFFPLPHKGLRDFCKQRFRWRNHPIVERASPMCLRYVQVRINSLKSLWNESWKSRTDGFHAQRTHAV